MALGEILKQSAKNVIGNQVNEALTGKPAAAVTETLASVVLGQIQAMQKALKEDQELAVFVNSGAEQIRVAEIYVPTWQILVLTGLDADKNLTRVICPADTTQLICKVLHVSLPATPTRVKLNVAAQKAAS